MKYFNEFIFHYEIFIFLMVQYEILILGDNMSKDSFIVLSELFKQVTFGDFILYGFFFSIPVILKYYKYFLNINHTKSNFHLETLDKLTNDVSDELYNKIYQREKKSMFFKYLIGKEIFSTKKRELLFELLNKEFITKSDIQKYSFNFKLCNDKLHVKITLADKIDDLFLKLFATLSFIVSILSFFTLLIGTFTPKSALLLITIAILLLFYSIYLFLISNKVSKLKNIIEKIEKTDFYIKECKDKD